MYLPTRRYSMRLIHIVSEIHAIEVMNFETPLCSTLKWFTWCYGAFSSHCQEHRGEPLLSKRQVLLVYLTYGIKGSRALRPIRRTNDAVLVNCSCLSTQVSQVGLEPTLCWTEIPELESGDLNLSATPCALSTTNPFKVQYSPSP